MTYQLADRAVDFKQSARLMKNPPLIWRIAMYLVCVEMALPFLAIVGFVFDRGVSKILYGLGLDPTKITPLFFLQDQYDFFLTKGLNANLQLYDFHIFLIVAWLALSIVVARLVTALVLVEYLDARIEFRAVFHASFVSVFLGWLLVGPASLFISMDPRFGASSTLFRYLMVYSPRAFLCMQAVVFCIASVAICEGLILFLQLAVAVWRRGRFVKSVDS